MTLIDPLRKKSVRRSAPTLRWVIRRRLARARWLNAKRLFASITYRSPRRIKFLVTRTAEPSTKGKDAAQLNAKEPGHRRAAMEGLARSCRAQSQRGYRSERIFSGPDFHGRARCAVLLRQVRLCRDIPVRYRSSAGLSQPHRQTFDGQGNRACRCGWRQMCAGVPDGLSGSFGA